MSEPQMNNPESENLKIALVGSPNCGKTSLFNSLTGSHQKVANYPGVTVERRAGKYFTDQGEVIELVDLPGIYSLNNRTLDERVTCEVVSGTYHHESAPDLLLCVIDSTNLRVHLRLVLELKSLGIPMILALNMNDLATRDDIKIDAEKLSRALDIPVINTIAVRNSSLKALKEKLNNDLRSIKAPAVAKEKPDTRALQKQARILAHDVLISEGHQHRITRKLDDFILHPILGFMIFFALLFGMFQAVFSWAETPMELIDGSFIWMQGLIRDFLPDNWFRSLLADGVIGGVGSVLVFLPQIMILFLFILILEASGYMTRAAFIMDRLMAKVGLNGRAFIPLLSSFACAVPGIMATRTIEHHRDRITTIMVAPLMTCSARIPVYTLIIAAFIPNEKVFFGLFGLQGIVFFGLYVAGIVSALIVAAILRLTLTKGTPQPFLMELPKYQMPRMKDVVIDMWERVRAFLRRAGTIILMSTIALWALTQYPKRPPGESDPEILYSFAGIIGQFLQKIFAPLGFNWEMSIALIPGMAAREVAISALGTVYSMQGDEEQISESLVSVLQNQWSLPTALAFLTWFIFAPQCFATLATTRRETNSWGWTGFMMAYLFTLAYGASLIVNQTALALMN